MAEVNAQNNKLTTDFRNLSTTIGKYGTADEQTYLKELMERVDRATPESVVHFVEACRLTGKSPEVQEAARQVSDDLDGHSNQDLKDAAIDSTKSTGNTGGGFLSWAAGLFR
jgi:hypothetical protein